MRARFVSHRSVLNFTGVKACDGSLAEDVDAVHTLVENLRNGIPPSDARRGRMSPWFQSVLTACEAFCVVDAVQPGVDSANPKRVWLCGKPAVQHQWQLMAQAPEAKKAAMTEPLKRFFWLLTNEQQSALNLIVQRAVKTVRARTLNLQAIADRDDDGERPRKSGKAKNGDAASSSGDGKSGKVHVVAGHADAGASSGSCGVAAAPKVNTDKAKQKAQLLAMLTKQKKVK